MGPFPPRGRPPKPRSDVQRMRSWYATDELYGAVCEAAARAGVPVSRWVSRAVEAALARPVGSSNTPPEIQGPSLARTKPRKSRSSGPF